MNQIYQLLGNMFLISSSGFLVIFIVYILILPIIKGD